jgi:hypothetical protein
MPSPCVVSEEVVCFGSLDVSLVVAAAVVVLVSLLHERKNTVASKKSNEGILFIVKFFLNWYYHSVQPSYIFQQHSLKMDNYNLKFYPEDVCINLMQVALLTALFDCLWKNTE